MSSVWTRPNAGNVSRTPAVEGGEYADQAANPGHADGAAFVRQLIGDGAKVEATGRSIEYWSGDSMSDTGLAYNISGRATVIEAGVGERLAGFQDPIKAIFGTSICHDKTVIVKRKYVVGGAATITPERAPARTVQVREDVQSVELQRYGGDVTMNTNLFLRPADAEAEMTMKLDAQKKQLENKLVELGYNEIFDKALRLPDVAVRANPTFSNSGGVDVDSPAARAYARTVYFRSCFGAFAKHEFPLANLLASCKTSGAYTSADGPGTVLVIPHGSSEMLRYTKSSSMDYSISGLRTADQKPVTMAIENVAQDPSSGVKIMVHVPPTSYARSAALPSTDKGMLSEDVSIFMVYPYDAFTGDGLIPDLQNGGWKNPKMGLGTLANVGTAGTFTPAQAYDKYEEVVRIYEADNVMTLAQRQLLNEYFSKSIDKVTDDLVTAAADPEKQKEIIEKILTGNMRINLSPTMSGLGRGLRQGRTAGMENSPSTKASIKENGRTYDFGKCTSIGHLFYNFVPAMLDGIVESEKEIFIGNAIKPFAKGDSSVATKRVKILYAAMTTGGKGDSAKAIHNNFDVFILIMRMMACINPKVNPTTLGEGVMLELIKLWTHVEDIKKGLKAEPTAAGTINMTDSPQIAIVKLSNQYSWIMGCDDTNVNKTTNVGQLTGMFTIPPGTTVCQLGKVSEWLGSSKLPLLKEYLKESCRLTEAEAAAATTSEYAGQFAEMKENAVKSVEGNDEIGTAIAADEWMKWIADKVGFAPFACLSLPLTAVVAAVIHREDSKTYGDAAEKVEEFAGTAWGKLCTAAAGCTGFIKKLPSTVKFASGAAAALSIAAVAGSLLHPGGYDGLKEQVASTVQYGLDRWNTWTAKEGGPKAAEDTIEKLRALNSTANGGHEAFLNGTEPLSYLTQSSAQAPLGEPISFSDQVKHVRYNSSAAGTPADRALVVRELRVKMSSAIIAKCGSDTGELLVGYPMTGVSTNQRTESMTVALRVYLGAILKKPENVTIIPHVAFEGIVVHDDWFNAVAGDQYSSDPVATNGVKFTEVGGRGRTGYAYPGTYATRDTAGTGKIEVKQENAGPLGHLDDPYYMECVNGLQVYKAAPMQTVSYSK